MTIKLRTTREERGRMTMLSPYVKALTADINDLLDALIKEKRAHAQLFEETTQICVVIAKESGMDLSETIRNLVVAHVQLRAEADDLEKMR